MDMSPKRPMRPAKLLETVDLNPENIDCANRLRPVSDLAVNAIVASITELGEMMDEIHVRRVRHKDNRLVLMAGAHRLAAAKKMGHKAIRAKVWDCSDDWAELLELDDNLAQADLSPLDLAVFLAARKRVYEKLHPETVAGVAGAAARWNASEPGSFASTAAEARGISERQVQKIVAAGNALDEPEILGLRAAEHPPTLKDLLALSKVTNADHRSRAIAAFASGLHPKLGVAIQATSSNQTKPAESYDEQAFKALLNAWRRAPSAARRKFAAAEKTSLMQVFEGGSK